MRYAWMLLIGILGSCGQENANAPYVFPKTPVGEVPQPAHNLATERGVALGKKLFFDPMLSANNAVSCATCHHTDKAFSDGVALTTMGISGNPLLRHSPALFNLAWYEGLFWDGGSKNIEAQAFGPLTHPDEMGIDLKELIQKLQADDEYPGLFKEVWGTDSITTQKLVRALAQYERTLLSFNSPYDQRVAGNQAAKGEVLKGEKVFTQYCSACHTPGLFTDLSYHANGIDTAITDRSHELTHFGRYRITNDSIDLGKFKTPSLRNLAFTAPYMHDGRFATLDDVFAHYFRDHTINPLADSLLKSQDYSQVDPQQKKALKAFLMSLSDSSFIRAQP